MKKKIKYNPVVVKKTVLWVILGLLVVWLGYAVISSYFDDRITSSSIGYEHENIEQLEEMGVKLAVVPNGDYQTYLKVLANENAAADPALWDIEWQNLNFPKNVEIEVDVLDGEAVLGENSDSLEHDNPYSMKLDDGSEVTGFYFGDDGTVTWKFNVPENGMYYIELSYVLPKSNSGANAERKVLINGKVPFDSISNITFYRKWRDSSKIEQDINGNDIKPSQSEVYVHTTEYLRDTSGYISDPYLIRLNKGMNTFSLESLRESLVVTGIKVVSVDHNVSYDYASYINQKMNVEGYKEATAADLGAEEGYVRYEGENSYLRSSPTLYGISDRTSPANYPSHPVKTKYNAIGGTKWSTPGDWIAWEVEVAKAGMYYITLRAKQDLSRGMFSTRKLYINGEVPFEEANACRFFYDSEYQNVTLGGVDGEYYLFYLEEGKNEIKLEATLGEYGLAISNVQSVVDDLNSLYLKIISITTTNPDEYQEYNLYGENARIEKDSRGRDMVEIFRQSAVTLNEVSKYITELTGEKSSLNNTLDKIVLQIGGIVDGKDVGGFATNPANVTKDLTEFKTNLSSLGTWILEIQDQSLTIESLYVHAADAEIPNANANFFAQTWFSISGFFQSFFFDYESIGVTSAEGFDKEIEVWYLTSLSSGREQANAIKSLIDSTFIPNTGINVILKVLAPSVLLPATLAGTGPDVAINVEGGLPVNYALRGAVYNVAQQKDFYQVTGICAGAALESGECVAQPENYKEFAKFDYPEYARFQYSSMVPLELEGGYYGLPDTASFLVLFYRTDIFEDNGWTVPKTWSDVKALITELQVSNLEFYMPLEGAGTTIFATMLYQRGGQFYRDDETASAFSDEVALRTFEDWCSWFTDYSISKSASFVNRFRSGEMPIGISSYDLFNTLTVFAPDIAGKWEFAPLPGYYREDGTYSNSGSASTTADIIMKAKVEDEEQLKQYDYSWEFLKWWTSTETQSNYARELESILGAAARHTTANVEAFKSLPWTKAERTILLSQWEITIGVPEIAGGYYVGRNLENAIRAVIDDDVNARETFQEYIVLINAEITRKRQEFKALLGEDDA